MAQVTSTYQSPTFLVWSDDLIVGGAGTSTSTKKSVSPGGKTYYLLWQSTCKTFQVQWRTRRRYSPSHAITVAPSGVDVWEDWGDWQGSDLSEDTAAATTRVMNNSHYLTAPFVFAYSFSEYDRIDYQVRVRVIDESSLMCSEWTYESLVIAYDPIWSYTDAILRADGGVDLTVTSNWTRGFTFYITDTVKDNLYGKIIGSVYKRFATSSSVLTINLPANCIQGNTNIWTPAVSLSTSDGGGTTTQGTFAVGTHTPPTSIVTPVVTITDTNESAVISVVDADYNAVSISAQWTDCYGQGHLEELDVTGNWQAELPVPPYGIEVTYRVAATNDDGWKAVTLTHTVKANGRMSWLSDDGDYVEFVYDTSSSSDYKHEGEQVKCAGRTIPVARLGAGGTRSLSAAGTVLGSWHNAPSAWLPEVETLRKNVLWTWRTPIGERYHVAITSVDQSGGDAPWSEIISVAMVEVE